MALAITTISIHSFDLIDNTHDNVEHCQPVDNHSDTWGRHVLGFETCNFTVCVH